MRCPSVLLVVFALLVGCIPSADVPLSDAGSKPRDTNLLGTWFWKGSSDKGYVHIGLDETGKTLRIVLAEFEKDGRMAISEFSGHTTTLDHLTYLNLKPRQSGQEETGYLVIKYELNPTSLGISIMNPSTVSTDIENGVLRGVVWTTGIRITASQKALRRYVARRGEALFSDINYLTRLVLP